MRKKIGDCSTGYLKRIACKMRREAHPDDRENGINRKRAWQLTICLLLLLLVAAPVVAADTADPYLEKEMCSSFVVGTQASVDGSTMTGYTCDGNCDFQIQVVPAAKHNKHAMYQIDYMGLAGGFAHTVMAQIPDVPQTYQYFSAEVPFANEYQVFFGENTDSTNSKLYELTDEEALIDWHTASALALMRGRTAREAITALGALIEQYGLNGSGESYEITDPTEAWIMEIAGMSHQWVAVRIPPDEIAPHANRFRICQVDLSDSENYLGSPNLIQHAIDGGTYNPATDGPFCFEKAYSSASSRSSIGSALREWRFFSLLKPSQSWEVPVSGKVTTYPLSVKPDSKKSLQDMLAIFRDYYQGTDFDNSVGAAAGPFHSPERFGIRRISTNRSIATPSTGYFFVSQARSWLPDPIGGVAWVGFDAPYSAVVVPFYVGIENTPESYRTGDFTKYSPDSMRWQIQALDTFSNLKFSEINRDIRAVFDAIEADEFDSQAEIEQEALQLYQMDASHVPALKFLNDYSLQRGMEAMDAAQDTWYTLLSKYQHGGPSTTVSEGWLNFLQGPEPE
jgi:dipeptidase